jgi:hypothetical protein
MLCAISVAGALRSRWLTAIAAVCHLPVITSVRLAWSRIPLLGRYIRVGVAPDARPVEVGFHSPHPQDQPVGDLGVGPAARPPAASSTSWHRPRRLRPGRRPARWQRYLSVSRSSARRPMADGVSRITLLAMVNQAEPVGKPSWERIARNHILLLLPHPQRPLFAGALPGVRCG